MSLALALPFLRRNLVRAVVAPGFMFIAALAAKCGDGGSSAGSEASSGGAVASASGTGASTASSIDPKKFCASLLPRVQALIKLPLTVLSADDSHTDQMHTGDEGYVACVNGNGDYRATVIMSDDPDKAFTNALKKGYDALPGFGDVARTAHSGYQWVDVMKGHTFCEAIVTIDDKDIAAGDWKQTGGKMCMAAFALR
jgi:hypothetical protein